MRRTVEERGREEFPPANESDAAGDNRWIYEFYRVADSLDMQRFLACTLTTLRLTFANYPTSVGKQHLEAAIGGLWKRIKGMSHSLSGAWSLHDGKVGIAEGSCMYTRLDDTLFTILGTMLRRRGDLIGDLRIHVDVNGL